MAVDPMSPKVLVSVSNEMEAAAIVDALADHGILGRAVGGYTSGFKAEAPGNVSVVVGQSDVAQAERILAEIRNAPAEVDWSTVDFRNGQSPSTQEDHRTSLDADAVSGCLGAASQRKPGRFQFGIASLLALQAIVSVALATWRGLGAGLTGAFVLAYLLLLMAILALIVSGTVTIASDLSRARQIWTYVGRALIVGPLVLALLLLFARILKILGVTP